MSKLPTPGRRAAKHNILPIAEGAWDDELEFNTQGSSQWDSLCHVQHQASGLAYNGFKPDAASLAAETTAQNDMPTLDHWHAHGGIAGRGVLLDYKLYAEEKGIQFHPMGGNRIKVDDLEACARHFGVEFRPGDVLVVRTGATEVLDSASPADLQGQAGGVLSGLHGCEETARWLWNKRFAAAASDSLALEAYPPLKPDGTIGGLESIGTATSHFYTYRVSSLESRV